MTMNVSPANLSVLLPIIHLCVSIGPGECHRHDRLLCVPITRFAVGSEGFNCKLRRSKTDGLEPGPSKSCHSGP